MHPSEGDAVEGDTYSFIFLLGTGAAEGLGAARLGPLPPSAPLGP
jgi:hypothetical protein